MAIRCVSAAQENAALPPIADVVKIEFPKGGYTFNLNDVAKGIKIEYTVRVEQDYPGVVVGQTGPSFNDPPGPSGLHPHESITGGGQFYSLVDFGRGSPPKEVRQTIKKGVYSSGTVETGLALQISEIPRVSHSPRAHTM